eukprot:TRINITY_DN6538_c0_g2_i1.p1 TRINITY_DN6538_c0_g2~~TRINITY_DN6538_c0_g2_i1.p1  ORF type:complete len:113 (-),score=4.11 TRINITY_DN6538_c0_g2_i1:729-1067(-)
MHNTRLSETPYQKEVKGEGKGEASAKSLFSSEIHKKKANHQPYKTAVEIPRSVTTAYTIISLLFHFHFHFLFFFFNSLFSFPVIPKWPKLTSAPLSQVPQERKKCSEYKGNN